MQERRLLPRTLQNLPVRISVLAPRVTASGAADEPEDAPLSGTCVDMSLAGACFRVATEVAPGTLVRIESGDSLWLGEVVHCRAEADAFLIGTHFEHSVIGLGQLQRTLQRLDWAPASRPVPSPSPDATAPASRRL